MTEVLFLLELFDGGLDLGVRGGAALEEIADFAKEHDVLGRGRGGGSGGLLLLFGLEKLGGFGLEALADGRDDLMSQKITKASSRNCTTAVRKAP